MRNYLAHIAGVVAIPLVLTLSSNKLNSLPRRVFPFKYPYLTIPILELNSAHLQARGVRVHPQALVACLSYLWSHCKLKTVSPVEVILQLTAGKEGGLAGVEAAWATSSVLHGEA